MKKEILYLLLAGAVVAPAVVVLRNQGFMSRCPRPDSVCGDVARPKPASAGVHAGSARGPAAVAEEERTSPAAANAADASVADVFESVAALPAAAVELAEVNPPITTGFASLPRPVGAAPAAMLRAPMPQPQPVDLPHGAAARVSAPQAAAVTAGAEGVAGTAGQVQLAYGEIVARARQVEYEAGRRVARLDLSIGLSEDQATRAYQAYARASPSYDPIIPIEDELPVAESAVSAPVEAQIYATLTGDQQDAFGQEWLDRDLWWTEIVAELAVDFPVQEAAPEQATEPAAHQGGNIFDILNPGR